MRIIIIGGVAAGMSAASKLKRLKPDYEVVVYEKTDIVSFGACGLPYYVGGFFDESEKMIARKPEKFIESGIDLKIFKEVIDVDTDKKELTIKDSKTGETFKDNYDKLMIATGARSTIPPIKNVELENVTTLKTMEDGIRVKELLSKEENKNIVIIGAGFIGIEAIEAAKQLGKNVSVIQRSGRVLKHVFDTEITEILEEEIIKHEVNLHLNEKPIELIGNKKVEKVITDKNEIDADVVILATGVKPNTEFMRNTGIKMLDNGAIIIDEYGKTSIEDIYSAGDCASIGHIVTNKDEYIPLATGANKLGRIVGENLAGLNNSYQGSLGSSCIKVMNLEAGSVGITEEKAKTLGLNYKTSFISDFNQTNYYPGRDKMYVKLIYHAETKVILGGQVVGYKDAVQRANVIATAIFAKLTTKQLGMLDLCYAPPFARTWDILNIAGNVSK